jgi:CRP-like cAMP-binding protein
VPSDTRGDGEIGNRLLKALPRDEYERLAPHLEAVRPELKQTLYAYEEPIPDVYFLHEGVVSLIQFLDGEEPVEVATVGNEGMVGLPVFHGADRTPARAFVQIPGEAMRMERETFRRLVTPGSPLHDLLHRYTQALMVQLAQNSACNRRHSIEQRFAKWLCLTQDRVRGNEFPLTQEFLAQMLGVRRAGVSEVASRVQQEGLIHYHRGQVIIVDLEGLRARTCECYRIIRSEFDQMVGSD